MPGHIYIKTSRGNGAGLGEGIESAVQTYLQGALGLGQQQAKQIQAMANLSMQNQRMLQHADDMKEARALRQAHEDAIERHFAARQALQERQVALRYGPADAARRSMDFFMPPLPDFTRKAPPGVAEKFGYQPPQQEQPEQTPRDQISVPGMNEMLDRLLSAGEAADAQTATPAPVRDSFRALLDAYGYGQQR